MKQRGSLYERCALAFCEERALVPLRRNVVVPPGEIDLLAEDTRTGALVVIEVRGRASARFRPSRWLSAAKIARLRRIGAWVAWKSRRPVRVLFLEVVGRIPDPGARDLPPGLTWEAFEIPG